MEQKFRLVGDQSAGRLKDQGIVVSAALEGDRIRGPSVSVHGKPGQLAVVTSEGTVVASGEAVGPPAMQVSLEAYRNHLRAESWKREVGTALALAPGVCLPEGDGKGVLFSAQYHEGLSVTVNGQPAHLAVMAHDGTLAAQGELVADEVMAVSANAYRDFLRARGHLHELPKPPRADMGPSELHAFFEAHKGKARG